MTEAPWRIRVLRSVLRRLPRGRYVALSTIAPSRGHFSSRLAAEIGGARFDCDLSDQLSREVCFTGLYEPPVTRVFQQQLRPGGTVVDVGANWGYFSLIAAALVGPSGTVIAVEPDPRQFDALRRNITLNGFAHVRAARGAASSREGTLTLVGYADGDANRGVSRIARDDDEDTEQASHRFAVPSVTLDALTAGSPHVDLVKIDVEGAEDLVLAGMHDGLMAHRYRAVLLELHPGLLRARGVDPDACLRELRDRGYRGWTIDASPAAYRRAVAPNADAGSLLRPLDDWRHAAWPHLLWLC